jgi:threonine/homoserine/homoserine lactone efflux protein
MKAYVITTGILFGILTVIHIARLVAEGPQMMNPWFILVTVIGAALCIWAGWLLRRATRS